MEPEEIEGGEGDGAGEGAQPKFVEIEGKKFIDDGEGKPKLGDDGKPLPFIEKKQEESPEARKTRLDRMQEQHKAKHPELYDVPKKKGKKLDELDYGQKAYLVAKGIEDADEVALVTTTMAESGKTLEEVLGSGYFKAQLKELKDEKLAAGALPNKGKRGGQSAINSVEYWLAKGGLPPDTADNRKLRADVVNARMKKESSHSNFTSNPVAGNV